jgi:hypothetical protein
LSLKFKWRNSVVLSSIRALGCCCLCLPYDVSYLWLQRLRYERARPVILNGKNNKPLTTSKNHIKTRAASDLSLALAIQISFFSLSLSLETAAYTQNKNSLTDRAFQCIHDRAGSATPARSNRLTK